VVVLGVWEGGNGKTGAELTLLLGVSTGTDEGVVDWS
jgi:hypothetical protein